MADEWEPGRFAMAVKGKRDSKVMVLVDGLVSGLFALDERDNDTFSPRMRGRGWCLTHIPTGFAIRHMVCSQKKAQEIGDLIQSGADWNFTDVSEATSRGAIVKSVMSKFPNVFVSAHELGRAAFASDDA